MERENEPVDGKAFSLRQEVLGEKHPDTISSMADLAATYLAQGQYDEDISVKVLDLRREVLGEKHPNTLQAMHDLAITWYTRGRRHEAISLISQALEQQHLILGSGHPLTNRSAQVLATWQGKKVKGGLRILCKER